MLSKIRTFVLITFFASLIWLFAEAESLGEAGIPEVSVRIGSNSADRLVSTSDDWRNHVSIELRGSRGAIEDARLVLGEGLLLTPGVPGVPDSGGTVDLLAALRGFPELSATGIEVISVTPIRTQIVVTDLITAEIPLRAELEGVSIDGPVEIDPPSVLVRLPETIYQSAADELALQCVPAEGSLESLPASGVASVSGRIALPPELRGVPGVAIIGQQSATMRFRILSTLATHNLAIVPVQVAVPSIEFNEWRVRLSADNASISATITGPRQLVSGIADEASGLRLVGLLYLRTDELNLGITSKALRFGLVTQDGLLSPLPPSVTVEPSTDSVNFTIERVPVEPSDAGE